MPPLLDHERGDDDIAKFLRYYNEARMSFADASDKARPRTESTKPAEPPRDLTLDASRAGTLAREHISSSKANGTEDSQGSVQTTPRPTGHSLSSQGPRKRSLSSASTATSSNSRHGPSATSSDNDRPGPSKSNKTNRNSTAGAAASTKHAIPQWFLKLKWNNTRDRSTLGENTKLESLKSLIGKSLNPNVNNRQRVLEQLIDSIHDVMFIKVTPQLVRNHQLLGENGLQGLFTTTTDLFPYYIKADAEELWHRWAKQDFETDLVRGIKFSKDTAASIKPGYSLKRRCDVCGNNDLINGQWWPSQLCLVRDGAHGSSQGGVAGRRGEGAWSIVLSSGISATGDRYPDHDLGDEMQYCGTDSKIDGEISEFTQRLIETSELDKPLRVIRSSQCDHSPYKPEQGFRYDGLYRITGFQLIDRARMRHRFDLVRVSGQDPIRHDGPGKRPSKQELYHWKELHKNRKFIVGQ